MNKNVKLEIIKSEFINIIKDYPNFPFGDRQGQEQLAGEILDQVFEKTHLYVGHAERKEMLGQILDTVVFGLRQIQKYQDDPEIEEIMINGLENVYIKRRFSDSMEKVPVGFKSPGELRAVIEKLLEGTGRRVDRSSPLVDTRLADGSRVNIIMEPLALKGPYITIRKFPASPITAEDLIKYQTVNQEILEFLKLLVDKKKNLVISGSTSAGKTTTLGALTNFIATDDRVVVIEEIAEIRLPKQIVNQVYLETRPANVEGRGEYTIRDLLKNALRMRPDRIIVGEVRGGEAFDMLAALNTGHKGSFTTLHANSAEDGINRLEGMILTAGMEQLPLVVIKSWIRRSLDFLIHQQKVPGGHRKVTEVAAIEKEVKEGQEMKVGIIPLFNYQDGKFISHPKNLELVVNKLRQEV